MYDETARSVNNKNKVIFHVFMLSVLFFPCICVLVYVKNEIHDKKQKYFVFTPSAPIFSPFKTKLLCNYFLVFPSVQMYQSFFISGFCKKVIVILKLLNLYVGQVVSASFPKNTMRCI